LCIFDKSTNFGTEVEQYIMNNGCDPHCYLIIWY